jgi:hypothetical protein
MLEAAFMKMKTGDFSEFEERFRTGRQFDANALRRCSTISLASGLLDDGIGIGEWTMEAASRWPSVSGGTASRK